MLARYQPDGTVRVDLGAGETLGICSGPIVMEINPVPGLLAYDEMVERGIPIEPMVPGSASKLGLKRALAEVGEWPAVKAAIASDDELQEDWELATEIRRADPLVQAMIAARGYADQQVDALLVRAAELIA